MRLFHRVLLIALGGVATVIAKTTPPKSQYLVHLKHGAPIYTASDLCFEGHHVYFLNVEDSTRSYLSQDELQAIERDNSREGLVGFAVGAGATALMLTLNYYAGGGNQPGVWFDRKSGHILAGLFFAPAVGAMGGLLGDALYSERVYIQGDAKRNLANQGKYACDSNMVRPSLVALNGRIDSSAGVKLYRDLGPEIKKQKQDDSVIFAGFPLKHRLQVSLGRGWGLGQPGFDEAWHIGGTRLLGAVNAQVNTVSISVSRLLDIPEFGDATQYAIHLGLEKRLFSRLTGQASLGLGWLNRDQEEEFDFLAIHPISEFGLVWSSHRGFISVAASLDYIFYHVLFRAGAGIAF